MCLCKSKFKKLAVPVGPPELGQYSGGYCRSYTRFAIVNVDVVLCADYYSGRLLLIYYSSSYAMHKAYLVYGNSLQ